MGRRVGDSGLAAGATIVFLALVLTAAPHSGRQATGGEDAPSGTIYREAAGAAGIDFVHDNGMSGEFYLPEITGSGVGLFDYDNDGDLDVYLVQGDALDEKGRSERKAKGITLLSDRLFRNDLVVAEDGGRQLHFTDVTREARIPAGGYGMGVASGDVNNDGWVDLYVTNLGSNRMLLNNGDGTFSDITEKSGTDDRRWSTSASFFDLNGDGWLDLYVANYVDFTVEGNRICYAVSSATDYCGPDAYNPQGDSLFLNRGDGTFEDITSRSRVHGDFGAGLGVVTADFNGDGWTDVYVANDGDPNILWLNQKDGTFVNEALLAGVALNNMGSPEASMGVDAADFDEDGDVDLFMTHIMEETNTLYQNLGDGLFEDRTIEMRLAGPSLRRTAFGTAWTDYDNDGWADLVVLNGAVRIIEELARQGDPYPLHQPNQLFRNGGQGAFLEVTGQAGEAFEVSHVSRGVASGDLDNDGAVDLVISNNNGPAQVLLNQAGKAGNWIGLRLLGRDLDRDILGAVLEVEPDSGHTRHRIIRTDGSYCSARDPRLVVGLAAASKVNSLRVRWPDGEVNEWKNLGGRRYYVLRQGGAPAEVIAGTDRDSSGATVMRGEGRRPAADETSVPARSAPAPGYRELAALREGLRPVPLPDLASLEDVVEEQLREVEKSLAEASGETVPAAELADAYGQAAQAYHAYEMFRPAEACYQNAALLGPADFRWPYLLGLLYHANGEFDKAMAGYLRAIELQPEYSAILINTGDVYLQENDLAKAEEVFQKALRLGTNVTAARYGLGRVALNRRDYRAAVDYLELVLREVPQANRVHHALGLAYRGLGDFKKAEESFSRLGAVGLRPVDPLFESLRELIRGERSHLLRGRKAFAAGDYSIAVQEFGEAVRSDPKSVRARVNLAVALSRSENDEAAIREFRRALELDGRDHTAHYNLGILLARKGDHEAAVEYLEKAVMMSPSDSEAHYLLGRSLQRLGRREEALNQYEASVRANPNYENAILAEAALRVDLGQFREATLRLKEAHSRLPHQGRIAHSLARLLAGSPDTGVREGALALDLALRVYKAHPTVTHAETVALALAELGRCEEAAEWQDRAVQGARNSGKLELAARFGERLRYYRAGEPCRP